MPSKIITFVKTHPYMTAGIVFGVGAVALILLSSGGSSSTADTSSSPNGLDVGPDNAAIQAGDALQAAQLQSQAEINALQASIAGSVSLATIAAGLGSQQLLTEYNQQVAEITGGLPTTPDLLGDYYTWVSNNPTAPSADTSYGKFMTDLNALVGYEETHGGSPPPGVLSGATNAATPP